MIKSVQIEEQVLHRIGEVADGDNLATYVVGGYVRDLLLGKPVKDIDVVVVGDGVRFAEKIAGELDGGKPVVFEKFGTAMLHVGDRKLEFVGARKESYNPDSRKPVVTGGTLAEDLARRDFTINAMAVSLNRKTLGTLEDPFHGREDLGARILRTPLDPKTTFDDDPLRMMRAARFTAQLGFKVESSVRKAIMEMHKRISIVSQERISDEFLKMMATSQPSSGLLLLFETGLMEVVFPEVAMLAGVDQRKDYHHKDVFRHTLKVVDNIAGTTENVWLRMAALLHDIAKPKTKAFKEGIGWTFHGHEELGARMVKPIFRRMRFPLEHVPYVENLVRLHLRPMALVDEEVTDSAVRRLMFDAGRVVDDLMMLCRADITSKNPKLVEQVRKNYDAVIKKMGEVEEKDRIRNWQPPLRGDEIMKVLNLEPGRSIGDLKDAITDAILDGLIPNDHEAALDYLLKIKDEVLSRPSKSQKR
ncbi:MAG: HD domain-containing protein [Bacteroidota bacterium]